MLVASPYTLVRRHLGEAPWREITGTHDAFLPPGGLALAAVILV
jgi:hypothetical protein